MDDRHEVTFEWPHSEPNHVIVTGTFDQWSSSITLTKEGGTYKATTKVPWAEKIAYKFVVDGNWATAPNQPTETDWSGNVNNVYTAPSKPPPHTLEEPPAVLTPEAVEPGKPNEDTTKSDDDAAGSMGGKLDAKGDRGFINLVAEVLDTVAATSGTSSALEYVASGLGAAIQTMVGVDPINPEKIPEAKQGEPTPEALFDAPITEPVAPPELSHALIIPLGIAPANAHESKEKASENARHDGDSPSPHMPPTASASAISPPTLLELAPAGSLPQADSATEQPSVDAQSFSPQPVPSEPTIMEAKPVESLFTELAPAPVVERTPEPAVECTPEPAQQPGVNGKTHHVSNGTKDAPPTPSLEESKPNQRAPSTPTTPTKAQPFPSSDSPSSTKSSSPSSTAASRKKRASIFGKINLKSIFSSEKKEKKEKR